MTTDSPERRTSRGATKSKDLKPFNSGDIKILLLEGLNATGQNILRNAGYQVEAHPKALGVDVLKEKIKNVHAIGIRQVDRSSLLIHYSL